MKSDERTKTQENVKLHFQAPPMLVQIFPRQFFPFYNQLVSRTENLHCQNFCSKAVAALSRRSNFVSKVKEIRNLQQRTFELD